VSGGFSRALQVDLPEFKLLFLPSTMKRIKI